MLPPTNLRYIILEAHWSGPGCSFWTLKVKKELHVVPSKVYLPNNLMVVGTYVLRFWSSYRGITEPGQAHRQVLMFT